MDFVSFFLHNHHVVMIYFLTDAPSKKKQNKCWKIWKTSSTQLSKIHICYLLQSIKNIEIIVVYGSSLLLIFINYFYCKIHKFFKMRTVIFRRIAPPFQMVGWVLPPRSVPVQRHSTLSSIYSLYLQQTFLTKVAKVNIFGLVIKKLTRNHIHLKTQWLQL